MRNVPDSKVYGANMGPTWVLSAPDGPHVGPMNLAIRDILSLSKAYSAKQKKRPVTFAITINPTTAVAVVSGIKQAEVP